MAEACPTQEYKCLLCLKPYNQPRELPCNHTFCCSCLTSYIDNEYRTEDGNRQYFPCPVCETPITPRDVGTDVKTWGTLFTINSLFIDSTSKSSGDESCDACQREGESNPAVVWCTGCTEMLCKQCKTYHDRIKVAANHRLVPMDRVIPNTTVDENCPNHDGRPIEVYCLDHSSMCCHTCVSVSHKHCNHIKPIDDVIKTSIIGKPFPETAWEHIKDEATKMLEEDESEMALLNTKENDKSVTMTRIIHQAKDKLDGLNKTFQLELEDQCNALRKQLSDRTSGVKKFHTNSENCNVLMTRIGKQGTDRQRFITREKTKHQLSGHYRRMDQNTNTQPNTFDLNLNMGTVIGDIMKLTTIAKVDVTSNISSTAQNANDSIGTLLGTLLSTPSATAFVDSDLVESQTQVSPTVDVWTSSVSHVLSVDCRSLGGETTPRLTGGVFTDSGELLVVDKSNGRLVLFDSNYCCKREYEINNILIGMTRGVHTDEILVLTLTGVMKYTLRNGLLTKIGTDLFCKGAFGIAVLGEQILVSTRRRVIAIQMNKRCMSSAHLNVKQIAASTHLSMLYYIDGDDIGCKRMDSHEEGHRYNDPGLRSPTGIGLDRDSNVYVCGHDSANVYIVSPDGLRGKVLVSRLSTIRRPFRIIVHPTKQEFVVTSDSETNSFEVYRFSDNP